MRMRCYNLFSFILSLIAVANLTPLSGDCQNMTPRPTVLSVEQAATPLRKPTPIRRAELPLHRIENARLEAVNGGRAVFSEIESNAENRRLYYWEPETKRLLDTEELGIPGSVKVSEDGRYMLFLHNEAGFENGIDHDDDGVRQIILRMYHFDTRQVFNFSPPARSATPLPGQSRSQFQIYLDDHTLSYSVSTREQNSNREDDAPWHVVNMLDLVYLIEGTPTPTLAPTETPVPLTPTPRPLPVSSPDMNRDGYVDSLDLMVFQLFWHSNGIISSN